MSVKLNCKNCNKEFFVKPYRIKEGAKYCSINCAGNTQFQKGIMPWNKGKHHSQETKQKISLKQKGRLPTKKQLESLKLGVIANLGKKRTMKTRMKMRIKKLKEGHINKKGYRILTILSNRILEHIFIWEKENGIIPEGYHLHHINGDKLDNRIENLRMMSRSDHTKLHWKQGDIMGTTSKW